MTSSVKLLCRHNKILAVLTLGLSMKHITFFYIIFLPLSIIVKVLKIFGLGYRYVIMFHDNLDLLLTKSSMSLLAGFMVREMKI